MCIRDSPALTEALLERPQEFLPLWSILRALGVLRRWGEARTRLGLQRQLRLTGPQGRVHGALSRALSGLGLSAEVWGSWRSAQGT
eukprot:13693121-Alexandrium_andersonii.AAC.1